MLHGATIIQWGLITVVFGFPIVLVYAMFRLTQLEDQRID
jgi:hypothetical protein